MYWPLVMFHRSIKQKRLRMILLHQLFSTDKRNWNISDLHYDVGKTHFHWLVSMLPRKLQEGLCTGPER